MSKHNVLVLLLLCVGLKANALEVVLETHTKGLLGRICRTDPNAPMVALACTPEVALERPKSFHITSEDERFKAAFSASGQVMAHHLMAEFGTGRAYPCFINVGDNMILNSTPYFPGSTDAGIVATRIRIVFNGRLKELAACEIFYETDAGESLALLDSAQIRSACRHVAKNEPAYGPFTRFLGYPAAGSVLVSGQWTPWGDFVFKNAWRSDAPQSAQNFCAQQDEAEKELAEELERANAEVQATSASRILLARVGIGLEVAMQLGVAYMTLEQQQPLMAMVATATAAATAMLWPTLEVPTAQPNSLEDQILHTKEQMRAAQKSVYAALWNVGFGLVLTLPGNLMLMYAENSRDQSMVFQS